MKFASCRSSLSCSKVHKVNQGVKQPPLKLQAVNWWIIACHHSTPQNVSDHLLNFKNFKIRLPVCLATDSSTSTKSTGVQGSCRLHVSSVRNIQLSASRVLHSARHIIRHSRQSLALVLTIELRMHILSLYLDSVNISNMINSIISTNKKKYTKKYI